MGAWWGGRGATAGNRRRAARGNGPWAGEGDAARVLYFMKATGLVPAGLDGAVDQTARVRPRARVGKSQFVLSCVRTTSRRRDAGANSLARFLTPCQCLLWFVYKLVPADFCAKATRQSVPTNWACACVSFDQRAARIPGRLGRAAAEAEAALLLRGRGGGGLGRERAAARPANPGATRRRAA